MQQPPPLGTLGSIFLWIGNLTFGGGTPTIVALHRELVERRRWLTTEQYGLAFGLARVTPGTNVLAFCAATGWFLRGWPGAVIAVLAACLPSAGVMWAMVSGAQTIESIPWARAALSGTAAAVAGLMASNAVTLIRPQWKPGHALRAILLAGAAFAGSVWLNWSPVPILAAAAVVGYLWPEPEEK